MYRFRIVVLADDSTLVTNIILLDRFVKRVAGTTVANILNEIKKVSVDKCLYFVYFIYNLCLFNIFAFFLCWYQDSSVTVLSTLFKTIIGKEVTVLIKLTDANVDGDSNLYNIVDLCDSATEEVAIVQASPSNTAPSFSMDGVCF